MSKRSQQKLAGALGVGQSVIANWEKGYREPKLKDLTRMAEVLGVKFEDLIK